ncbi:hypothetical protein BBP40_003287 [Aspergillus hancockii]|nr:hypothetical protein BBP40_003287 [Aspergillus hancockii]
MTRTIETHYATESESAALGHINITSFLSQPFWPNVMPGIEPAACLPLKQARCLEKLVSPNVHVFSAVDPSADRVVGYSRWTVPWAESQVELSDEGQAMLANSGNLKPEGMREDMFEAFFKALKEKREVYLKDDDMILDMLATLPEYQGQGVGTKLLQWGVQQADAHNARIYLEATMEGYPLYRKYGWQPLEELLLDYAQYGGKGVMTLSYFHTDHHNIPIQPRQTDK